MATKRAKIENMLTKISQFLQNRELSTQNENLRNLFTTVHDALVRLQNSVKETSPGYRDFDAQQQMDPELWTRSEPPMREYFDARGIPEGVALGAEEQGNDIDTDYVPTRLEGTAHRTGYLTQLDPVQIDMEWSSTLQNCSLFDADPFRLLIVLLSVSIVLF